MLNTRVAKVPDIEAVTVCAAKKSVCGRDRPSREPCLTDVKARSLGHSITSSARNISDCGMVRPSALAVLRLMTSSYLIGFWNRQIGRFLPRRMRSTYSAARRYWSMRSGPNETKPPSATKKR